MATAKKSAAKRKVVVKKDTPFCIIEVPDVETAAYLRAVLSPSAEDILNRKDIIEDIFDQIAGGEEGFRAVSKKVDGEGVLAVWEAIGNALCDEGIDSDSDDAPWMKDVVPDKIESYDVTYNGKDGVEIGCTTLSLTKMRAMVKKCEEG